MTLHSYDPAMTLREARTLYFEVNQFGLDGGYGDAWVDFKLGPIPMPFPNTPGRVRAVRYHDLHHLLTGYDTDTRGEFEISAWELGAGCGDFTTARLINLSGLAAGVVACPGRIARAFARGLASRSLYGDDLDALLARTVGEVRAERVPPTPPPVTAAVLARLLLTWLTGVVVGLGFLALVVPLLPFAFVALHAKRRREQAVA